MCKTYNIYRNRQKRPSVWCLGYGKAICCSYHCMCVCTRWFLLYLLACSLAWVNVCVCIRWSCIGISFPKTIVTIAVRSQPAEVSAWLSQTALKWKELYIYIYIYRLQTESERMRDRQRERGFWQISVTMCLTATSSVLFTQCLWWSTHIKVKQESHAAKRRMAPLQIQNNCHPKPESAALTVYLTLLSAVRTYSELKWWKKRQTYNQKKALWLKSTQLLCQHNK